jgi:hypothetical protein
LAAFVRARFESTDERTRTVRVTKTGIAGAGPKIPPPNRQEGRNGPDYRKKDNRYRENVRAVRILRTVRIVTAAAARPHARLVAIDCVDFEMRSARIELYDIVNVQKMIGRGFVRLPPFGMRSRTPVHL